MKDSPEEPAVVSYSASGELKDVKVRELLLYLGRHKLLELRDVWAWLLLIFISGVSIIGESVGLFHEGLAHYLYIGACATAGIFGVVGLFSWASRSMAKMTASLRYASMVAVTGELFSALELKRPDYKNHWKATSFFSRLIAEDLGIPQSEIDVIARAAEVMDIGLLDLLDEIGRERADSVARQLIDRHTVVSESILSGISPGWEILPLVRHHHERYDGSGYPDGLKGEDIPIGARIIAAADAFVAMCSLRPYRERRSREEALEELKVNSGSQFDPQVVDAIFRLVNIEDGVSLENIRRILFGS